MTGIEFILLLAVMVLAAQVLILQSHYNEKLSDQAAVLDFLLTAVSEKDDDEDRINQIRDKIFSSSQ
jgi:hypothetical protein